MSAIKWTGKAFTLAGRILTNEAFEEWLKAEGQQILEKKLQEIGFGILMGRTRARWKLQGEIRGLDELGEAFRTALVTRLDTLPRHIGESAEAFNTEEFRQLVEVRTLDWVAAVPRRIVIQKYRKFIKEELANAAALQSYPGLSDTMLTSRADEAEQTFFDSLKRTELYVTDPSREVVLNVDSQTNWGNQVHGHYYVARSFVGMKGLNDRKNLKAFVENFELLKKRLIDRIGSMNKADHQRLVTSLADFDH